MGNCLALCKPNSESGIANGMGKQGKVVRIAKPDGKILEFSSPIAAKDVLASVPASGISVSKEGSEHLSPDYELKGGRLYHLLPSHFCPPNVSSIGNGEDAGGIKRVKLVITRQQLQLLVAKQISIQDILLEAQNRTAAELPASNWKPKLDAIPEGNE
ncbi:hypothetical protein L6164_016390 [Bauhinia variegata]|uniref:Uncharacterized protein n=1 Tax=Bauhinia variegata TaxID=167791 RepID=A0ACB9NPW9_BAUVA|nr:hypothetical protein L6164_016390 [Bauhinia variegata]